MKFSIRDLFLVTVIVAVCVAWWIDHRRQAAEIERFNSVIDWGAHAVWVNPPSSSAPAPNPPKP